MKLRSFVFSLAIAIAFTAAAAAQIKPGVASELHSGSSLPVGAPINSVFILSGGSPALYICNNNPCTVSGDWITTAGGVTSFKTRTGAVVPLANDYDFSQIAAGSNTNVLTMGTGGALSPLNLGQVAGNQLLLQPGLPVFSGSSSANSGSILASHVWQEQYTFVSALGQTLPSPIATVSSLGSCGTGCNIVLTKPTIPTGYTGWSVFACDVSVGPCTSPVNVPGCTNITTNCTITASVTSGTAPPNTNTAIAQPPNVQATNGPPGLIHTGFFPKDDGKLYPWFGVDTLSSNGNGPIGTPTFTNRTFFTDCPTGFAGTPGQTYKNAFVSLNHCLGTGTVTTNQDRGLAIQVSGTAGDSATHYAEEAIQAEADWVGTETFNGSPDGEITSGSFQVSDSHIGLINMPALNLNGMRVSVDRQTNGTTGSCGPCYNGVASYVYNDSNSSTNSAWAYSAFTGAVYSNVGNPSDIGSVFFAFAPSSKGNRFSINYGLVVQDFGTNIADWNIFSVSTDGTPTSGRNWFGGNVYLPNIMTAASTINVNGPIADTGSLSAAQLPTPTAPTVNVNGGTGTTYTYGFVGRDANGGSTPISATSNASAAATLNGSNFVNVCLGGTQTNLINGYSSIDVRRTASGGTPSSTGFIGTITPTNTNVASTGYCLTDNGLAGDGSPSPTVNTTGGVKAAGAITTAPFTVANLPSAASSTGQLFRITDSTAVASEGQTCTGGSSNVALAFSNGTSWKCF